MNRAVHSLIDSWKFWKKKKSNPQLTYRFLIFGISYWDIVNIPKLNKSFFQMSLGIKGGFILNCSQATENQFLFSEISQSRVVARFFCLDSFQLWTLKKLLKSFKNILMRALSLKAYQLSFWIKNRRIIIWMKSESTRIKTNFLPFERFYFKVCFILLV